MLVGWVLAIVLAFEPKPLYPAYAVSVDRPGGLSALADQQIAAGVMWVPGSIAFTIAIIVFFYRWLGPEPQTRLAPSPAASDLTGGERCTRSSPRTSSPARC